MLLAHPGVQHLLSAQQGELQYRPDSEAAGKIDGCARFRVPRKSRPLVVGDDLV